MSTQSLLQNLPARNGQLPQQNITIQDGQITVCLTPSQAEIIILALLNFPVEAPGPMFDTAQAFAMAFSAATMAARTQ